MNQDAERQLDVTRQRHTLAVMNHGKKRFSASRAATKQGPPLGLIIALALAGGAVLGSGGTYLYFKRLVEAKQSAPPVAGATLPAQIATTPAMPPQGQFRPAPQPPGEAPPGKVWSVEHGHWHDAPVALTPPAPASAVVTPAAATAPAPEAAPPPVVVPAPVAVPK